MQRETVTELTTAGGREFQVAGAVLTMLA